MEMATEFAQEVIAPKEDKRAQVQFLANSVDYFTNTETFDFNEFTEQVVGENPQLKEEFQSYQEDFGLNDVNGFSVSKSALKDAKRKIKGTIKLDTNIQIKLDYNNPEASNHFIEKGYDEARGMYFYKVFFNEEG